MVIWFTGISGTGKTTIAKQFYKFLKKKYPSTIYFDGDKFRKFFGNDIKYTLEDRDKNALRLTRLVKNLSSQKMNIVVAANITSFKFRIWCRKNIKNYFEIYISATKKNLMNRDYKKLYKNVILGRIKNVIGIDLPYKKPKGCHLYITNNLNKKKLINQIPKIFTKLKKRNINIY